MARSVQPSAGRAGRAPPARRRLRLAEHVLQGAMLLALLIALGILLVLLADVAIAPCRCCPRARSTS